MVTLSAEQERAVSSFKHWWQTQPSASWVLAGPAGSGKSTIIESIVQSVVGKVFYICFTGKAAYILRRKGLDAQTVHSLIYKAKARAEDKELTQAQQELKELREKIPEKDIEKNKDFINLQWKIKSILKKGAPLFDLLPELKNCSLLVIDEFSMISEKMGEDIMSFGIPVLACGDPNQLPPVGAVGFFKKWDFKLQEIHRQAQDSPIIYLATQARLGIPLKIGEYGNCSVFSRKDKDRIRNEVLTTDQIIVGRNKTRVKCNNWTRKLLGITDPMPTLGERLVCLNNNSEKEFFNGAIWKVATQPEGSFEGSIVLDLEDETGTSAQAVVQCLSILGRESEIPHWDRLSSDVFTYGYALTCHKSQGSEWDNVLVFDESSQFQRNSKKHAYTAFTRAAKKLTIVI